MFWCVFCSMCNKQLDFLMIQWKMLLKICSVLLHLVHISAWLFPWGRITRSLYIHCDKSHTSLHTTTIVPIDNKSLLRDCNLQAQTGIVLACLIFLYSKWQNSQRYGWLFYFRHCAKKSWLNCHVYINHIHKQTQYKWGCVLMVVSCVLFRFFLSYTMTVDPLLLPHRN